MSKSSERVTVTIDENGNAQFHVEGCPGAGCKELTSKLESAVGLTVDDKPTSEMHARSSAAVKAEAKGR